MVGWQATNKTIYEWLATSPEPEVVEAVLACVADIAKDPYEFGYPVAGELPIFTVPVQGTYLAITYLLAEQFHVIQIISIEPPEQ